MTARPVMSRVTEQDGFSAAGLEGWSRDADVGPSGPQRLWDSLDRARAEYAPRVLAAAEDAVFRFYLPLARSLAAGAASAATDRDGVEQAAELGLAQAVLGWRGTDAAGFERFATGVITSRLRRFPAGPGRIDLASGSPSPAGSAGLGAQAAPGGSSPGSRP